MLFTHSTTVEYAVRSCTISKRLKLFVSALETCTSCVPYHVALLYTTQKSRQTSYSISDSDSLRERLKILSEYVSCVYACETIACIPTLQGKPTLAHKVARLQNSRYSSTFHRQAFAIVVNSLLWIKRYVVA